MSRFSRRSLVTHAAPMAAFAGLVVAAGGASSSAAPVPGGVVLVDPFRIQDSRINEPSKYDTGYDDALAVDGLSGYRGVLVNITVTETSLTRPQPPTSTGGDRARRSPTSVS